MKDQDCTISCIIPAYNEGPRIRRVLELASKHHLISEVIVVNDGSTDDTQEVIEEFSSSVTSVRHPANRGKSAAIHTGISLAKGTLICFLDADLTGLTSESITQLITPVTEGRAGMAISLRKNSPWIDRKIGLDYISGERVFHRDLLDGHLDEILALPRFGFEVFLNKLVIAKKVPLKIVDWSEVESPYKSAKLGTVKGAKEMAYMLRDIFRVVSVFEVVGQFIRMRRLMVKTSA